MEQRTISRGRPTEVGDALHAGMDRNWHGVLPPEPVEKVLPTSQTGSMRPRRVALYYRAGAGVKVKAVKTALQLAHFAYKRSTVK